MPVPNKPIRADAEMIILYTEVTPDSTPVSSAYKDTIASEILTEAWLSTADD